MTHENKHETQTGLKDNGQGILGLPVNPYERMLAEENPPISLTDAAIASEEAFIASGQGEIGNPAVNSRDYMDIETSKYPADIDKVEVILEDGEVVGIIEISEQVGDVAIGLSDAEKPPKTH